MSDKKLHEQIEITDPTDLTFYVIKPDGLGGFNDFKINYDDLIFGDVIKSGTTVENQVAIWGADKNIKGLTGLIYDGNLHVVGNIIVTGLVNGIDIATDVAANTAKVTNAAHTGDVIGSGVLTIADNVISLNKLTATGTPSASTFLRGDNTWAVIDVSGGGSNQTLSFSDPILSISDGNTVDLSSLSTDLSAIYQLYQPDGTNPFVYTDNSGALHIDGDIYQNGSAYETHIEQLYTKNDMIITRDGATAGMAAGTYSGITAKLYDGVNDGQLVFDNEGVARVGDVGALQPLATREESPVDGYFAKWNSSAFRFETVSQDSLNYWKAVTGGINYSGGNVGINNPAPTEKLDVAGNIKASGQLKSTIATGTSPLTVSSTTAVTNLNADLLDGLHSSQFQKATIFSASISNAGYTKVAYVNGSSLGSSVRMSFRGTAGSTVYSVSAFILVNHYQDIYIRSESGVYTQATIRVTSGGNEDFYIEIKGGTSYAATILVSISPQNNESITANPSSVTGTSILEHLTAAHTMRITSNSSSDSSGASSGGHIAIDGNLTAKGEITAYSSSDRNLKSNIVNIDDGLEIINKLRPVRFNWNEKAVELTSYKNTEDVDSGLIAQETEGIIPEVVGQMFGGDYKGIKYEKLVPYLIGAIQEMDKEIKELRKEVRNGISNY